MDVIDSKQQKHSGVIHYSVEGNLIVRRLETILPGEPLSEDCLYLETPENPPVSLAEVPQDLSQNVIPNLPFPFTPPLASNNENEDLKKKMLGFELEFRR